MFCFLENPFSVSFYYEKSNFNPKYKVFSLCLSKLYLMKIYMKVYIIKKKIIRKLSTNDS